MEIAGKKVIPDWDAVERRMPELIGEISLVLNRHSIDNALCVPDFILAENVVDHLIAFAKLNQKTLRWSES